MLAAAAEIATHSPLKRRAHVKKGKTQDKCIFLNSALKFMGQAL
jgi:hypothetical protein